MSDHLNDQRSNGQTSLKRGLKNRHIQLIALGGAIGTGLFLGASGAIFMAGPAIILGYLIAGFFVFLFMRQIGDMDSDEPMAGSFSYFANKYWGPFPGFLAGYNYWILYVMVGIAELTGAAAYMQFWFPAVATWKFALLFFLIINAINLTTVKAYGEVEFWFTFIKVAAICSMIAVGLYILVINPSLVDGASFKNLWSTATVGTHAGDPAFSGFFAKGLKGLILAVPVILFSFGGLELVGITAAEAEDPAKSIPKAVNQVIFRILIFYIGTMVVLLSLYHWSNLTPNDSPFVIIFERIGFRAIAGTLNFVVLTAALSAFNSCVYSNSRMIYGLSLQKSAPQFLTKTSKKGVPFYSILLAAFLTFLVVPLNYFLPNWFDAFKIALSFVVSALVISWAMISLAHLKFRKQKAIENHKTHFPSPLYPYTNYLCVAFVVFALIVMATPQLGMIKAVVAVPIWILFVYICYRVFKKH